jgi:glycine/D-amino acid oxidase-like deaminating enzyme
VPGRGGERQAAQSAIATRELRKDLATFFLSLSDLFCQAAWTGRFAVNPDGLPYIGHSKEFGHPIN